MAPTLYQVPASAPVRSVLVLAKALDIELELKTIDLNNGEHLKEEYLKINPQHTIPTLVEDDGYVLWDSHAIMTYLIAKSGKGDDLYPKDDIKRRATIDQRLHFDSGVLFARGALATAPLRNGTANKVPEDLAESLRDAYGIVEKFLGANDWVVGNSISIADIALGTNITTWDVVVPIKQDEFPKITAWLKRLQNLPYFEDGNESGLQTFKTRIESILNQ